jgi:hypothetical protein
MPKSKLSKRQVREIYAAAGTLQEIGYTYNVCPSHVGCIKRGMSHGDVTGAPIAPSTRKVLSAETIAAIKEHTGTILGAAKELGVCHSTIKKYRKKSYKRTPSRDDKGRFNRRVSDDKAILDPILLTGW